MDGTIKTDYTREELIALINPDRYFNAWFYAGAPGSWEQLAECKKRLEAGEEFEIRREGRWATDDRTVWLRFVADEKQLYYLPAEKSLR